MPPPPLRGGGRNIEDSTDEGERAENKEEKEQTEERITLRGNIGYVKYKKEKKDVEKQVLTFQNTRVAHRTESLQHGYVTMEYPEFEKIRRKIDDKVSNTGRMVSMKNLPVIIESINQ